MQEPSPSITYDVPTKLWTVPSGWVYEKNGTNCYIPPNYSTDLSSIPRYLWWLIAPFELSLEAPLVHDWIYGGGLIHTEQGYTFLTRADADALFYKIMTEEGVPWWRRKLAYAGVRAGGGRHWKGLSK